MRFQSALTGYVEEVRLPELWTFLFGCFYFVFKGVWTHALISFCLALLTHGVSWLIYPLFARNIIRKHYLRGEWIEI